LKAFVNPEVPLYYSIGYTVSNAYMPCSTVTIFKTEKSVYGIHKLHRYGINIRPQNVRAWHCTHIRVQPYLIWVI